MRTVLAAVAFVSLSGCFTAANAKRHAAAELPCAIDKISLERLTIEEFPVQDAEGNDLPQWASNWVATGCGKELLCTGGRGSPDCAPFPVYEAVRARASLESGCDSPGVTIVSKPDVRRDAERSYRLEACGAQYVCTSAPGRTDCKAALSSGRAITRGDDL